MGIVRCIATEAGILKPEWAEELSLVDVREITDPTAMLRMAIGLAWEEWYIPTILSHEGVIDHPGQMCVDGIYMNPDGESLSAFVEGSYAGSVPRVHEVKATYKSINTVGDLSGKSEWMWRTQIQAYCWAKETDLASLHVLFLCGDYKYPIKPQLKRYDFIFTCEELENTWKLLVEYRDSLKGRGL